jgi:hypothetical protein
MVEKRTLAFGALFLVDLILSVVMLATDQNLQTDFGGKPAYYAHWWGVLAMAVLDLVVGLVVVAAAFPVLGAKLSPRTRRAGLVAAVLWAVVAIAVMVGIVTTYSQVGFSSMSQFEQYLFNPTPYGGVKPYLPWLYDTLLAAYVVTFLVGIVALFGKPETPASG